MPFDNTAALDILQDREFIRAHGETLQWYQGAWCSCTTVEQNRGLATTLPDPSFADTNCKVCGGTGWMFPNAAQTIRGVISAVTQDKDLADIGLEVNGELVLSQEPGGPRLSDLDIIRIPSWTKGIPSMGQLVWRGPLTSEDSLFYNVQQIGGVWQANPATGVITAFKEGTDYTFSGRTITWTNGGLSPALGTAYSVRYDPLYEWAVFVPPMPRYERNTDLGQKVVLKKRHLVLQDAPNLIES